MAGLGLGVAASSSLLGANASSRGPDDLRMGVVVDTTTCIGCRQCEQSCKEAHGFQGDLTPSVGDADAFVGMRRPDVDTLTVVNAFEKGKESENPTFVKVQCMHCDYPACVSACIVGAFEKRKDGSVLWDTDKCIGCRYCMVACPFQIPTFEYHKAIHPKIQKCDFCSERTDRGEKPACVESCPVEALTYAPRYELVQRARQLIERERDRYLPHLYGETEVGGTSWMYLAGLPFDELAFPKLGAQPAPGTSEAVQHGIFKYFIPPISLFALLGGLMWIGKKEGNEEGEHS
jgi:Fe-S-cluster-containing dehydrogenase component